MIGVAGRSWLVAGQGATCQFITFLMMITAVAGCRPYHMYEGEFRPDSEVGTITQTYAVRLMTIDRGDTGVSQVFKLLPGVHRLDAEVYLVGGDTEVDPRTKRTTHHREGEVRGYVGRCAFDLTVTAGSAYVVDGGKVSDGEWVIWAAEPNPLRPPHSWAAAEKLDAPHCVCAAKK